MLAQTLDLGLIKTLSELGPTPWMVMIIVWLLFENRRLTKRLDGIIDGYLPATKALTKAVENVGRASGIEPEEHRG